MPPEIFSARWSSATVTTLAGPEKVGVQSIEYQINLNKNDHFESNSHLRTTATYGNKIISGVIMVKSHSDKLDALLDKMEEFNNSFSLQVTLSDGVHTKTLDFQECYLDGKTFGIDNNGIGVSKYAFTARDVKEGK